MQIRSLLSLAAAVALAAPAAARAQAVEKLVKRGAYLVRLGGCSDCHTPWKLDPKRGPVPDMSRMLSGHSSDGPDPAGKVVPPDIGIIGPTFTSFAMPFGIVYAPNLTPDRETGIGAWSEKVFIQSMRTGRHLGGARNRPILPPMPWQSLSEAEEGDLKAMFAYLKSIPPIRNKVPEHKVPPEVIAQMKAAADQAPAAH